MGCRVGTEPTTAPSALAKGFHCPVVPYWALRFPSLPCGACPAEQPRTCCAHSPGSAVLIPAKSAPRCCAVGVVATVVDRRHGGAALPVRLSTSTFPTKLWHLVHSPHIHSERWDIQAQELAIIHSLFQWELLSLSNACWAALYSLQATQFCRFCAPAPPLHLPQWAGLHWLCCTGQCRGLAPLQHRRDRPNLTVRIKRWSVANRQQLAAGWEGHSCFQQLHNEQEVHQAAAQSQ
ncbi:unnamed protein product [Coccothraustes coccothraustes]